MKNSRRGVRWAGAIAAAVWAVAMIAGGAAAQTNAPAAGGGLPGPEKVSLGDLFEKGGVLMYPLVAMSIVAVAFIIYYFFVLRRQHVVPEVLRRDVLEKIDDGLLADARTACTYRPCAFSEVTMAALDAVAATEKIEPGMLKEVIEGEGTRQSVTLQSQIQYLLDVAVIAPMVGLLGTVFGMIKAFQVVALDMAKAKPMLLASGVAEALITTAAGLIIGIPAMIFYAFFRGRTSKLVSDLEWA